MRLSMAAKIFGIAFILVLLMAVTATITMLGVNRLGEDLRQVDTAYLPIAQKVARIDMAVLEQEILFERALSLLGATRSGSLEEKKAGIDAHGSAVAAEIDRALVLLRSAQPATRDVERRVELVRLEAMMEEIGREQRDFQAEMLRVIDLLGTGGEALDAELIREMDRIEARFDAATRRASDAAAALVADAASDAVESERYVLHLNVALTVLAGLAGLLFSALIVRGLTRPVRRLVAATAEIKRGNLAVSLPVRSRDEIGELTKSFNHMAGELRVKEQIKETFGRYVDPRIVENLIGEDGSAVAGGESAVYTVYFSDIRGFTSIAERLTPSAVVNLINGYLTAMSAPVREQRGIIDKYIGDAVMAFWGPPFTGRTEHARLACAAALAQIDRLAAFQDEIPALTGLRRDAPEIAMRIGIATGEVVVGSIGSDVSRNYTVMGDTVNLGSRLEGLNKVYGTAILVSEETEKLARDAFLFRKIDRVGVVGREEPVRIFELMAPAGVADPSVVRLRDAFQAALAAWRQADWTEAEAGFRRCLDLAPEDGPSHTYLARLERLRDDPAGLPSPEDWDGVWRATEK